MAIGGNVRYIFRRRLFLLIGLFTVGLFFLVAGLNAAGKSEAANALAGPMRVLIVPMYLVWMVFTMAEVAIVGPVGLPAWFGTIVSGIGFAAGLAPYAFADYLINRRRQAASRRASASDSPNDLSAR